VSGGDSVVAGSRNTTDDPTGDGAPADAETADEGDSVGEGCAAVAVDEAAGGEAASVEAPGAGDGALGVTACRPGESSGVATAAATAVDEVTEEGGGSDGALSGFTTKSSRGIGAVEEGGGVRVPDARRGIMSAAADAGGGAELSVLLR